ncbi:MAG: MFS transporter [Anaerolineae bacterium]|nr:MFS transporter [Anaerolineae bacterium]
MLRDRTFQRLCGAQFTSLTAAYALFFAAMALVERITHSSAQMGIMILSSMLPGMLFGLVAGVVVDRYDRVVVVAVSNALRLLTALGFTVATALLRPPLLLVAIYLTNAILAILLQFVMATEGALLPALMRPGQLQRANAVFNASSLVAHGLGLALLGPLLFHFLGAEAVGLGGALLFLTATLLAAGLPRGAQTQPGSGRASLTWRDFRAGWQYIIHRPLLILAAVGMMLATAMTMLLTTLLPGFVSRGLRMPVETISWLILPVGAGFALGLVLVGLDKAQGSRERWIGRGMLFLAIGTGLLAFLRRLTGWGVLIFLAATVSIGLGLPQVNVPARTILQETPPSGLRGRVVAVQQVLGSLASTLPMPFIGALADQVGISPVLLVSASLVGSIGLAGMLWIRR